MVMPISLQTSSIPFQRSPESELKLSPEHDAAYFQLSQAYRRDGRLQEAQQALATYQRLIETSRSKKRKSLETPNR